MVLYFNHAHRCSSWARPPEARSPTYLPGGSSSPTHKHFIFPDLLLNSIESWKFPGVSVSLVCPSGSLQLVWAIRQQARERERLEAGVSGVGKYAVGNPSTLLSKREFMALDSHQKHWPGPLSWLGVRDGHMYILTIPLKQIHSSSHQIPQRHFGHFVLAA